MESSLTPPATKRYECIQLSSARKKLLDSGLQRDVPLNSKRNSLENTQLRILRQGVNSKSIERLILKPITKSPITPSPFRPLQSISKTPIHSKKLEKTPKNLPLPTCISFITSLWKTVQKSQIFNQELSAKIEKISNSPEPTYKEKFDFVVKELKTLQTGKEIPQFLCEHIEDLAVIAGVALACEEKIGKSTNEKLEIACQKFTVRTFSELKYNSRDASLYQALLCIIGNYYKKERRSGPVVEELQRIVKNPGLAVRKVKEISELVKANSFDLGKIYIETVGASFKYFYSVQEYSKSESNTLIISLLGAVYEHFDLKNFETAKSLKKSSLSIGKIRNTTKAIIPLRAKNIEKALGEPKNKVVEDNTTGISSENSFCEGSLKKSLRASAKLLSEKEILKGHEIISRTYGVDEEYQANRSCKNILLKQFFEKNGNGLIGPLFQTSKVSDNSEF